MEAPSFIALLLAAGAGTRLRAPIPKAWLEIRGQPVLAWSATRLARARGHRGCILAVDAQSLNTRVPAAQETLRQASVTRSIAGGASRQDSCRLAFEAATALDRPFDCVVVHDAARPFFDLPTFEKALRKAHEHGGAILGHPARDTLKAVDDDGFVRTTLPRERVFQAATPQVFRRDAFVHMLEHAATHGTVGTDEAGLAEASKVPVLTVPAPSSNIKLTYPEDLLLLPSLLALLDDDPQ